MDAASTPHNTPVQAFDNGDNRKPDEKDVKSGDADESDNMWDIA